MTHTQNRPACFLCTTPLQVLGAIDLVQGLELDADIILFDDFADYVLVGERLKQAGYFANVYVVDFYRSLSTHNRFLVRLILFFRMVFGECYLRKYLTRDICYDKLFTSSSAVSKMVIVNALSRRNRRMTVSMYDDGIGSYSGNKRTRTGSRLFQRAKSILHWHNPVDHAEELYLYQPELARDSGQTILKMPALPLDETNRTRLDSVFCTGDPEELRIKQRVILFDTFRKNIIPEVEKLDQIYENISEICGKDNVLLKDHPRSILKSSVRVDKFPNKALPFEIVYLHQENPEDKILVALNSTAVFTPKMIFKSNPRIMLIYRLVSDDPEIRAKRDALYLNMIKIYGDTDRISIPETVDEMRIVLKNWLRA